MKVRYTKTFTDSYGDTFRPGWIAEHAEPEALARIALGVCEQVTDDGAKSLKLKADAPVFVECASPAAPEDSLPMRDAATPRTSTPKRWGNK